MSHRVNERMYHLSAEHCKVIVETSIRIGRGRQLLGIKNWQYNPILAHLSTPHCNYPLDPTVACLKGEGVNGTKSRVIVPDCDSIVSELGDSCETIPTILFST